jgi:hypothetical protein
VTGAAERRPREGDVTTNHAARNRETFRAWRAWLRTQKARQDPVGDFARDYLDDLCAARIHTLSGLDHHLMFVHGADPGGKVLEARDRAWRAWPGSPA